VVRYRVLSVALICAASLNSAYGQEVVVDPFSRQSVIDAFRTVYIPALSVANDWTGNVATCDAGTTSAAYTDATIRMVNFYRAMSRLPSVSHSATLNQKSQEAALMMAANQSLTHAPPTSWRCYSTAGAEAVGRSNLASGLQ
jgi:uncharacterized protein YkwD